MEPAQRRRARELRKKIKERQLDIQKTISKMPQKERRAMRKELEKQIKSLESEIQRDLSKLPQQVRREVLREHSAEKEFQKKINKLEKILQKINSNLKSTSSLVSEFKGLTEEEAFKVPSISTIPLEVQNQLLISMRDYLNFLISFKEVVEDQIFILNEVKRT